MGQGAGDGMRDEALADAFGLRVTAIVTTERWWLQGLAAASLGLRGLRRSECRFDPISITRSDDDYNAAPEPPHPQPLSLKGRGDGVDKGSLIG